MTTTFKVACVQSRATPDHARSVTEALDLATRAVAAGAQLVTLPEAFDCLVPTREKLLDYVRPEDSHAAVIACAAFAKSHAVWLLAGSVSVLGEHGRPANRSLLFAPDGTVAARYDKIHMFDVDLPNGDTFRESDFYEAGRRAVVTPLPWGNLGLSICYDVRFPYLHRALAGHGAAMIAAPAAFSNMTGPLHWEPLLRARAIETGCFVVAPAQCGHHYGARYSHGHSLIIDPWGRVLAEAGDEPGFIVADLDLAEVARFRAAIPSLAPDRAFAVESAA